MKIPSVKWQPFSSGLNVGNIKNVHTTCGRGREYAYPISATDWSVPKDMNKSCRYCVVWWYFLNFHIFPGIFSKAWIGGIQWLSLKLLKDCLMASRRSFGTIFYKDYEYWFHIFFPMPFYQINYVGPAMLVYIGCGAFVNISKSSTFYTLYGHVCLVIGTTCCHYNDVIMGAMASQITSLTIVQSVVYSSADKKTHQRSASLAFVQGFHREPVTSPDIWPETRKMLPFDDVIMVDNLFYRTYIYTDPKVCEEFVTHRDQMTQLFVSKGG